MKYDRLKVGMKVWSRETKGSEWTPCVILEIDGDYITFIDNDGVGINSNREECEKGEYFRKAHWSEC